MRAIMVVKIEGRWGRTMYLTDEYIELNSAQKGVDMKLDSEKAHKIILYLMQRFDLQEEILSNILSGYAELDQND